MKIDLRQAFLLTILSWLVIAFFGSLPFIYSSTSLKLLQMLFLSQLVELQLLVQQLYQIR